LAHGRLAVVKVAAIDFGSEFRVGGLEIGEGLAENRQRGALGLGGGFGVGDELLNYFLALGVGGLSLGELLG
jgi:hypothetical protein